MEGVWFVVIHRLGFSQREVHSAWRHKWVAHLVAWWIEPQSITPVQVQWHPDGASWISEKRRR